MADSELIFETVDALMPNLLDQVHSVGAHMNNPAHKIVAYANLTTAVSGLYNRGAIPGTFKVELRRHIPGVKEAFIRVHALARDGEGREIELEAVGG